jgi:hypothetical protein
MIPFKLYFEQAINSSVAVLPGGFKPPTRGHFALMKELLQSCDKGVIFIGKSDRDGITQEMSYQIWSIYAPYLGRPIEIYRSPVAPVRSVIDYANDNPNTAILAGVSKKGGDIERYRYFEKNRERYPHVKILELEVMEGGISGTKAREKILNKAPDSVDYFVPTEIKQTDRDRIKSILGIP